MTSTNGSHVGISAQGQALYATADLFRLSVVDRIAGWERDRTVDRATIQRAGELGLTGIEVPKYLGGLGLGFREKVKTAEILSVSSMALAFSLTNSHNVAAQLARIGSTSHKRDLLPGLLSGRRVGSTALTEPTAGSDFGAIATFAQQTGDGWLLNGEKAWITNAAVSDVIICYAQTDPDAGSRGIASFLIDGTRPGFERLAPYDLSGGHIIGAGGFKLKNYKAGNEDLLTEPGSGFASALSGVNGARIYVAAMCNAMVRSSLEVAVEYGTHRQSFGRALLEHQGLAWSLATVANQLEASQLLTERAIDILQTGDTSDVILAAAHAKKFATEMAEPSIAACIQAMGAEGLRDRYPARPTPGRGQESPTSWMAQPKSRPSGSPVRFRRHTSRPPTSRHRQTATGLQKPTAITAAPATAPSRTVTLHRLKLRCSRAWFLRCLPVRQDFRPGSARQKPGPFRRFLRTRCGPNRVSRFGDSEAVRYSLNRGVPCHRCQRTHSRIGL